MLWLMILHITIFSTMFVGIVVFFCDESCLPYKRKMEKMFWTIRCYQNHLEVNNIKFTYKGKTFSVSVKWHGDTYAYGYYTVYINENHVITWHILHHVFSNSRLEEHHGDMKASEEYEIIQTAYKYAKKENDEWWNVKLNKPSYFD